MEIEIPSPNEKTQKRRLNEVEDIEMGEASSSKRVKLTEEEVEEELQTQLIERNLDHPGF